MGKEIVKNTDLITPENITAEDVKKHFCANATDKELMMFLQIAKLNKLNPFKREIYLVKYGDNASILTGYEVYLKRAERTKQYGGFKVWIEGEGFDMKACIDVRRKDWDNPLYHEVDYSEYVQMRWDKELRKKVPNKFWKEKPKTMLKKVVISQALRFAFPDELAGMPYVREEMNEEPNNVEVVEKPKELVVEPLPIAQNKTKQPLEAKIEPEAKEDTTSKLSPNKKASMNERFAKARVTLGKDYLHILSKFGVTSISQFEKKEDAEEALKALEDVSLVADTFDETISEEINGNIS